MHPPDCIFLFDDVFTTDECKYFIEMTDKYAIKGRETYGRAANVLADSINTLEIPDTNVIDCIMNLCFTKIFDICTKFKKVCDIDISGFESPTLRKITGATKLHKDGVVSPNVIHNGMCPATQLRNMSVIVALNSDYEGGELCFPEQERVIKLKGGQAIAFPPYWTHPHYTNELKNNTTRYTINLWIHDRPF